MSTVRIHGARVPLEQRDEPFLQVAVEALDRGEHLAAAELLRGPERVVPEVARELAKRSGVGRGWSSGRLEPSQLVLQAELVVEDAISATEHARCRREEVAPLGGVDQREVDVLTVLVEDAALDLLADRGRLEEGENGRAELTDPALVVDESGRLVDEEDGVEVRPAVGRRVGARLRPDHEHSAHVLALARPVGDGRSEEVHPRVDVEEQLLVDLQHRRVHASQRQLTACDARLELRKHRLRVHARKRSRLRDRAGSGQLTEEVGRDERRVDRQDDTRLVRRRAKSRDHAEHGRALHRPVVEDGEWQLAVVGLSDGDDLVADGAQDPPRALAERLSAKRRERLRRAEPLGRAADEQDAGRR